MHKYICLFSTILKIKIVSDLKESNKCPWSKSLENAILLENIREQLGITII